MLHSSDISPLSHSLTSMMIPHPDDNAPSDLLETDLMSPEEEAALTVELPDLEYTAVARRQQASTDLVRLYLQDIGRIPLLKKDEEVQIAQQVQTYLALLELQNTVAAENRSISRYQAAIAVHDQLLATLGHRPSYERWANHLNQSVATLKETLKQGKAAWADLAGLTVEELER
ncbi:MAG: Group 2 polymerase sigma factor / Cyanobacteria-specific RpoD-like sigma factor, type-7, partial [Cyanobacteriota bacterium]